MKDRTHDKVSPELQAQLDGQVRSVALAQFASFSPGVDNYFHKMFIKGVDRDIAEATVIPWPDWLEEK